MTLPKNGVPGVAWTSEQASTKFSELIERARTDGPQTITQEGRGAVVVVAIEEWKKISARRGGLVDFLMTSPLRGFDLELRRDAGRPRRIDL